MDKNKSELRKEIECLIHENSFEEVKKVVKNSEFEENIKTSLLLKITDIQVYYFIEGELGGLLQLKIIDENAYKNGKKNCTIIKCKKIEELQTFLNTEFN